MERYYQGAIAGDEADAASDNGESDGCKSLNSEDQVPHGDMLIESSQDEDSDEKANGNGAAKTEGSSDKKHVVKVRGLPWSASAEEVIEFFVGCKIRGGKDGLHFLLTASGRPSGEVYIEFDSEDDMKRAIKRDKQYMGKRYVEVYQAKLSDMDVDMRRLSGHKYHCEADKCVVKLRGLPFTCSKDDIAQFFSELDIVPNGGIVLVHDLSGRPTGEAFVRFTTAEMASKAIAEKHKDRIGHRYVEIFPSVLRDLEVAAGIYPQPPSLFNKRGDHHGGPPPHYRGGYDPYAPYGPPGYGYPPPTHGGYGRPTPYDRPHPPHSYRGKHMKGEGYGHEHYPPPPHYPPYDPYGPPNHYPHGGYGGYGYPPPRGYEGYPPPGGAPPPGGDPYARDHGPVGYPPPSGGPHPPPSAYGGGPPQGPPPGPPGSGHRVRMRGLPFSASQQDIYEFFNPMVPCNVHFIYHPNGKFSGEVDAEFRSHEEATDAMRYDRKYIDKRYIELFLYSHPTSPSSTSVGGRIPPGASGVPPVPPPLGHAPPAAAGGYAGGYQTF